MFDIGFSELMLVFIIGLIVLGPERFPVAIRMVTGWIRAIRSMAVTVQNELMQEFKLQESLKKVEEANKNHLSSELKVPMDELCEAAESIKKEPNLKEISNNVLLQTELRTISNPLVTNPAVQHDGAATEKGERQDNASLMAPDQVESSGAEPQLASLTSSTEK